MITTKENRAISAKLMVLGLLLAALMAASLLAAQPAHASTTFTVNSTEDHSDAVLTVGAQPAGSWTALTYGRSARPAGAPADAARHSSLEL